MLGTAGEMCIEELNNIQSVVLEIVKGGDSIKRNQIIKTDTQNTFCEIQAVFTIFHCAFSPVGHAVYYIVLYH
jgi:hypothetical protein